MWLRNPSLHEQDGSASSALGLSEWYGPTLHSAAPTAKPGTSTRPTNLKQSFASHPIPCQQTKHSLDARTLSDPLSRRATWPLCVPKT